jgi:ABC-type antimicrobial peptide transport system permease subunit
MALGAQQQSVSGMFVRQGLSLTVVGVACGLVTAIVVMRFMSSVLFKVNPVDPVTYLAVSIGILAVAFVASYLPARRAATVDPIETLRAE